MATSVINISILFVFIAYTTGKYYTENEIRSYRNRVVKMFQHAYDGYIFNAYPYDELRPLTCDGVDTWGSFSLTLVDALDTLAVMGNYSEFRRVAHLIIENMHFDTDINVSVFETNIRILGGLLSAHLLSRRAGMLLEPNWPCSGPLLRLAENLANRLLFAFDTNTGMPYGTVNLQKGLPVGETNVTCTACVGSFIIEFGTLSRLTGDPRFEKIAMKALYSLWKSRSSLDLVGNHIDVQQGVWIATEAGIGAGIDSYFEYLVKGSIAFQKPELMEMFNVYKQAIEKYIKQDDWYLWVSMTKGQVTFPIFQSLEAYWPGLLSLVGDIDSAMKTLHNYHQVWQQFGFTPEFYSIPQNQAHAKRESYPLRPELIESVMYLYQATKDPFLLDVGVDILESIESHAKTSCGYATVKDVRDHTLENRMESFFLAETTKYLYLLFDSDNFLHKSGEGDVIATPNGNCVIESGGYIFNTEAHPIDIAAVYCCSADKRKADLWMQNFHDNVDLLALLDLSDHSIWDEFTSDLEASSESALDFADVLAKHEQEEIEDEMTKVSDENDLITLQVLSNHTGSELNVKEDISESIDFKIETIDKIENQVNGRESRSTTSPLNKISTGENNKQIKEEKIITTTEDTSESSKLKLEILDKKGHFDMENILQGLNVEQDVVVTEIRINEIGKASDLEKSSDIKDKDNNSNFKLKLENNANIKSDKFESTVSESAVGEIRNVAPLNRENVAQIENNVEEKKPNDIYPLLPERSLDTSQSIYEQLTESGTSNPQIHHTEEKQIELHKENAKLSDLKTVNTDEKNIQDSKSLPVIDKTEVVIIGSSQQMTPETIQTKIEEPDPSSQEHNSDELIKNNNNPEVKVEAHSKYIPLNFTNSYEVLLCPIQPFISRLSLMGEMFFHD